MMVSESIWLKKILVNLPINSVLNIGSSDLYTRTKIYHYINENVFIPLQKRKIKIVHTDIQNKEGVDLVGNLADERFLEHLKKMRFDCVLCNNLLEHIVNRQQIAQIIQEIVPPGGYIIVSVPFRYPYHYDPFDTMYRPGIKELAGLFIQTELLKGEICNDIYTYWDKLSRDKKLACIIFLRSLLPFYKPQMWWNTVSYLPKMFKKFQVCCVLLKKITN